MEKRNHFYIDFELRYYCTTKMSYTKILKYSFLFTTFMYHIDIPHLSDYKEYKRLPPQEREKYVISIIKEILSLNKKKGVTTKQIEEKTYFHRSTIASHLNTLMAKGEVYNYPPNSRNSLYFPNGNLADPILNEDVILEDKIYSIFLMANQFGKFIYMQEKEVSIDGSIEIKGGIMIPYEERKKFFKFLRSIEKLFEQPMMGA